jgi:hypothetical protein
VTNHPRGALRCRTFVARPLGGRSELADEGPLVEGGTAEAGSAAPAEVVDLDAYRAGRRSVELKGAAQRVENAHRQLFSSAAMAWGSDGRPGVARAYSEATGAAMGFPTSFVDWVATRLSWAPVGDDDPGAGLDRDRFVAVATRTVGGRLHGGRSRGKWGPARIVLRVRYRQAWS